MPSETDPPILEYATGARNPGRRWPTRLLISAVFFLVLGAFIWDVAPRSRSRWIDGRVKSSSNLRQIGQAILLYCNDERGTYPDSFRTLLLHGDITSDVFVSPLSSDTPAAGPTTEAIADQLTAGGHLSYVYLGRGLTTQTATGNSIIAYENLSLAGNGANVLYGDGHVEWGNAKLITQIINKSASGKFPVTMPTAGN